MEKPFGGEAQSEPVRRSVPDRWLQRLGSIVPVLVVVLPAVASTFGLYLSFHDRVGALEYRMTSLEGSQREQKSDNKEQFNRINDKLDQILGNQSGSRPDMRGWTK